MKVLALIPARGGSKRLPGKNIRLLGGKPLIVWSIEIAKDIPEVCDILVTTDDSAIANVCREKEALVPWLRPQELASDTAGSVDVALHALDWYESAKGEIDGLLLLQPTSPFRTKQNVRKSIELFSRNNRKTVIGVSPTHVHPMWAFKMEGDYLVPFMSDHGLEKRSQDLPETLVVNGSFYLISPKELRTNKSFFGKQTIPLLIESPREALDIDTEWDFDLAELLYKKDA